MNPQNFPKQQSRGIIGAILLSVLLVGLSSVAGAELVLPGLFTNHMVLQSGKRVPVWGLANPGEKVKVHFLNFQASSYANEQGEWRVWFEPMTPGLRGSLLISGSSGSQDILVSDVVTGEVWICSGQSNMQWSLENSKNGQEVIKAGEEPDIRLLQVPFNVANTPLKDVTASWQVSTPSTRRSFSAVGYFFALKLYKELGVPIGIIQSAVGGTPAEAWTPVKALESDPIYEGLLASRRDLMGKSRSIPKDPNVVEKEWASIIYNLFSEPSRPEPEWFENVPLPSTWRTVRMPGFIDNQLGWNTEGSFWIRRSFMVSATNAGKSALLELGRVDDFDLFWINGQLIDKTGPENSKAWETVRSYPVPEGVLRSGQNVVIGRIIDQFGNCGLTSLPAAIKVTTHSGATIPLAGDWQARLETDIGTKPDASPFPRPSIAGVLYDGMIAPLIPFGIRGVIWYQGESNVGRSDQYRKLFPLMIQSWRKAWNTDFSFYFVQLAAFGDPVTACDESDWAELRDAQASALKLPGTGMVTAIDIGEAKEIHPRNKKDVGDRLASVALASDYQKSELQSSPYATSIKFNEGKAIVCFDPKHHELIAKKVPEFFDIRTEYGEVLPLVRNSPNSQLEGFALRGDDGKWEWANAEIQNDQVIVWSDAVKNPEAIRYSWSNFPFGNLFGADGFPVFPFEASKESGKSRDDIWAK